MVCAGPLRSTETLSATYVRLVRRPPREHIGAQGSSLGFTPKGADVYSPRPEDLPKPRKFGRGGP